MKWISKLRNLAKTQPLGCLFSAILALLLLSATIGGLIFAIFSLVAVPMLKDTVHANTGFSMSAANIYMNIFTGTCKIDKFVLENPNAYSTSDNSEKFRKFIQADKLIIKISPIQLLRGRIEIKSADLNIDKLNYIKLNNSTFNLLEFLTRCSDFLYLDKDSDMQMQSIKLRIKSISFTDASVKGNHIIDSKDVDFAFEKKDIADVRATMLELADKFDESKIDFVSESIKESLKEKAPKTEALQTPAK